MDRESVTKDIKHNISFSPNTDPLWIHPEEGEDFRLNKFIVSANEDIVYLDSRIKEVGSNVDSLLTTTTERLDIIRDKILYEKERLQDIIILCNKYTDFESTIKLTKKDFSGDFEYENGTIYCPISSNNSSRYNILSVLGNGYEGNEYAYDVFEKKYLSSTLDTSKRTAIKDNSVSTYWEYSRITASETEKYTFSKVNFDTSEAKCTLVLDFEKEINHMVLTSESNDIVISDIFISNDNQTYKSIGFTPTAINRKEDQYNQHDYVFSSGIIAFEPCRYVKVSLESSGYAYDTIAFDRKVILDNNDVDIVAYETTILNTARRHVVKINDLKGYTNVYRNNSKITSRELITDGDINVISLFCNTYMPEGLKESDLTFIFTINGKDYEVIPVNSQNNGKKIIRFSQGTMKSDYTEYIEEPIKSAKLSIILRSRNGVTPYVNNIKILIGDEE